MLMQIVTVIKKLHRQLRQYLNDYSSCNGLYLLIHFIHRRRRDIAKTLSVDILANICSVILSLLTAQILAAFFGYQSVRGYLIFGRSLRFEEALLVMSAILLAKGWADIYRWRWRGALSEDFAHFLRLQAFDQHLNTDPYYHEQRPPGRSLLRFSGDLGSAQRLLSHGILRYGADSSMILIGTIAILCLDPTLALAVVITLQ